MPVVVVIDLPGGPAFVDAVRRIWDRGDCAFPVDRRLPPPARAAVVQAVRPGGIVDEGGERGCRDGLPSEPGDALVVATSGTTGRPKGVVLTHAAVEASARATSARLEVDATNDHWLACLPLAHVGGLAVVTRALVTGTALTVLPAFDVESVHSAAKAGATLVSLVPTALQRIDAGRFRRIVLGGSAPPVRLPSNVLTTYGMTETGSGVVYDGLPLDDVDVRVVGGEIQLRGPMLLRAYRDGSDPKDASGWLRTGDLGELHHGRLTVLGRRSDLIITGGENVWPDAVEAVLRDAPGVADVAVAGRADAEWGQQVTAFVVPVDASAPPALADLRDWVKDRLPAFCAPRAVVLVDRLPRTSLGKVRRADLVESPGDAGEAGR